MVCEFSDREGHLPVSKCEGSSFVSVEGGKEVPKLRFSFFFCDFSSHRLSSTGDAFLSNVEPRRLRL